MNALTREYLRAYAWGGAAGFTIWLLFYIWGK